MILITGIHDYFYFCFAGLPGLYLSESSPRNIKSICNHLKARRSRNRSKSRLMTANEQDSRVAVVHGCFTEGGNSILSAFSWKSL